MALAPAYPPLMGDPDRAARLLTRTTWLPGRDLGTALVALMQWGDRYYPAPGGPPRLITHSGCGGAVQAILSCQEDNQDITAENVTISPGPGHGSFPREQPVDLARRLRTTREFIVHTSQDGVSLLVHIGLPLRRVATPYEGEAAGLVHGLYVGGGHSTLRDDAVGVVPHLADRPSSPISLEARLDGRMMLSIVRIIGPFLL